MPSIRPRSRPAPKPDTEKLLTAMRRAGLDAETAERVCRVLFETAEQEQAAWNAANEATRTA